MLEGKYTIELNLPGDGRTFLNFWDNIYGNDVIAEVVGPYLEVDGKRVTMLTFLKMIKQSIEKQNDKT